jgi:eukaryotic-like serine/threonine-protein kinase
MESERHTHAKVLFNEVADLPPSARAQRLRELSNDAGLIAYVEQLLKQTLSNDPKIAQPILMALGGGSELRTGDTLGAWRLTGTIGQGGMGTVFRAERSDGHFQQDAAVKLLSGIPSAKALEYLARERQILATLSHPNIARLLDGGATPSGQPYLVMEYIHGTAIDKHVKGSRLGTADVLRLIITICDALAFAHQRLVVHCDIKPSNILVTEQGRPMLLDFGIARLLDTGTVNEPASPAPGSGESSHTLARAFTPRYASPEQQGGLVLTTATDIFSLGRMLAELLETSGGQSDAELQAVIAKAAHAQADRRYATVAAFAGDLERWLGKLPLTAVPDRAPYRLRKFMQRNWPWVSAGAVAAVLLGVAAHRVVEERDRAQIAGQAAVRERDATRGAQAETLRQRDAAESARGEAVKERDRAGQAEQATALQRDRAQSAEGAALAERDRARRSEAAAVADRNRATQAESRTRQTNDFLVSLFNSASPNAESGDIKASKLIALAEERVEKDMDGQPELQGELFGVLGNVQTVMGNPQRARDDYLRAIAVERRLDRPLVLAGLLDRLAMLRVTELGTTGAEAEAREAVALYDKHAPGSKAALDATVSLGHILSVLGKHQEGAKLMSAALVEQEAIAPDSDTVATTLICLAQNSMHLKKESQGLEQFRRALKIRAALIGEDHPRYLQGEELFVRALTITRNFAEAEERARRILAQRRKLEGNESNNVGTIMNELGRVLQSAGRVREAMPLFEEAAAIHAKRSGKQSTRYAVMLNNIAVAHIRLGNLHKSATFMDEAVGIIEQVIPSDEDLGKAGFRANLGLIYLNQQQPERAIQPLERAYKSRRAALGPDHTLSIEVELYLTDAALQTGKLEEAASRLARLRPQSPLKDAIDQLNFERLSALAQAKRGNLDAAITQLSGVDERRFKARGAKNVGAWIAILDRAELLARRNATGDRAQARELAAQVVEHLKDSADPDAPAVLRAKRLLAS